MNENGFQSAFDGKMAPYFPSLESGASLDASTHMFTQDIAQFIMPIGGRTEKHPDFSVRLLGDKTSCDKARQVVHQLSSYGRQDDTASVCDAIRSIAQSVAVAGMSCYEIVQQGGNTRLLSFTSQRLFHLACWYLQVIPRADWKRWKRRCSVLPAKSVWKVGIPRDLGGVRGHKRLLKALASTSHIAPKFIDMDSVETILEASSFDVKAYTNVKDIRIRAITRNWGWNSRDLRVDRSTEYYRFHKALSFSRSQAVLREHIIEEINKLFTLLSINCQLMVEGLPTPQGIEEMQRELSMGNATFDDVLNATSI